MSKGMSSKALLVFGLTGALGVGALAYYVKMEPGAAKVPPPLLRDDKSDNKPIRSITRERSNDEVDHSSDENKADVSVYVPHIEGTNASLRSDQETVPSGQDPLVYVAKSVVKESNLEGVSILGVHVRKGVAYVNFNHAVKEGMGEEQEGTFLKALQVTFGQFKNVKQVEIDAEGEPVTTLGSVEIEGPLDVVRPGESADQTSKSPEP